MSEEALNEITLVPINYFLIEGDFYKKKDSFPGKKYLLPSTEDLAAQNNFADVYAAWSEEGLSFVCEVKSKSIECFLPEYMSGDSIEIFVDTRDIKNAGFNHRFCHHFVFLPEAVDGIRGFEATKFRTEDTHPLCDAAELVVETEKIKGGYRIEIDIPAHCLFGFDPNQFDRIGFTYRINGYGLEPQHFSVITAEYDLEQSPSQWSRIRLK